MVDNLFFNTDVLLPGKIAIFDDFKQITAGGKVEGIISGGDKFVIEVNTGTFGFGSGGKQAGGGEGNIITLKAGTVAAGKEGDKICADDDEEKDGKDDEKTFFYRSGFPWRYYNKNWFLVW